jgi:predicted O-methyltransferase YrrM
MTEYKFTQDWFSWAPAVWEQLIPLLPGEAGSREFMEIGSFEGRSSVWIAENMMSDGDILCCVDTWQGGEEHGDQDMGTVEERFDHNMALLAGKLPERFVDKHKGTSVQHLAHWLVEKPEDHPTFDFIYIDGSHIARDVLTDACMAWPLLKQGGIMVFDDYMWGEPRDILHRPKPAIDAFVNLFAEEVDMVHMGYQLIVRKK